jgi:hypothetical protein
LPGDDDVVIRLTKFDMLVFERFGIGGVRIVGSSILDDESIDNDIDVDNDVNVEVDFDVAAVFIVASLPSSNFRSMTLLDKEDNVVNVSLNPAYVISNPECNAANQISRSEPVCALQYTCVPAFVSRRKDGGVPELVGESGDIGEDALDIILRLVRFVGGGFHADAPTIRTSDFNELENGTDIEP